MSENYTSNNSRRLNMQPTYNPYSQYPATWSHNRWSKKPTQHVHVRQPATESRRPHPTKLGRKVFESRGVRCLFLRQKVCFKRDPIQTLFFEFVVCVDGFQVIQPNVLERRRFHNCVRGDLVYLLVLLCRN